MEVEFIASRGVLTMSLDYEFFCVNQYGEEDWGTWAVLPMENGAYIQFVQNDHGACAVLYVDGLQSANVVKGMIRGVETGNGFNEPVEEPNDLRQWLRQLGRIPVEGSSGSLDVFLDI